ncbi:YqhG family protein [Bacillaceae bacterium Marseille-Q3522]|nr:YqhG family protein [Bacillaceae bacterium Marseille-Q3522]
MQQQEIHQFLERYFSANNCEIGDSDPGHLNVQLTIELDKELMNRPFYWHYLEKTGGIPNPMQLTFITDQKLAPEKITGEVIHFGSPRLHQIFQSAKNLARYIRLYENCPASINQHTALKPWLCLNLQISYQCDRKKDVFHSIGLQLINGQIVEQFHEHLLSFPLTAKIPDYVFTLSPLIKPQSGVNRIEKYIRQKIEQENHAWADEARRRWQKDINLLEQFYEEVEKGESYQTEKKALQAQYEPKITVSLVNCGLFYLR